jgi:NAD-dependent oxidoreductase involved in siderophore biosynthesis
LNRRASILQVGTTLGQLNLALDSFAKARDAATAAGILAAFSRQLQELARVVAGTR